MKPRNGLAKDQTIPWLFYFLGFYGLGVFRKIVKFQQGTME